MARMRSGRRYGKWVTVGNKPLGAGGNGVVWKVKGTDSQLRAIKVLSPAQGRAGTYRLRRFKDEIRFHISHPGFPGVLPMLDCHISGDLNKPSWYVMPVAVTMRQALGNDPEAVEVIAAVVEIATTLDALAAKGVFHRDVKPDNLFKLDSKWVVGDFGLVTYPEKEPRTKHGRRLGPIDYMSPEMRADADKAAPGPADVWSLGKTLWVLLTGQELPLPGTHRPSDPAYALQDRIIFAYAAELDLLLERSTQIDPATRPIMAEIIKELSACLLPPPEVRPSVDLKDLQARVKVLTAKSRQDWVVDQDVEGRYHSAFVSLVEIARDVVTQLDDLLGFQGSQGSDPSYIVNRLGHHDVRPCYARSIVHKLIPHNRSRPPVEVIVAITLRAIRVGEPFDMSAYIAVNHNLMEDGRQGADKIYDRIYRRIPVSSAQQTNALSEVRAAFQNSLETVMREVVLILAKTSPDSEN
jgi:serine/threonine protein kinase